nr:ABC transporter permease subunit [Roseococcus sp. MDT2-1-1]
MISASVIATLLGAGAALALEKLEFRGKRTLEALVMAPLVVPHFVVGLGFLTLFAQSGLPRGLPLLVLCHVVLVLPFVVRSVWISLKSLDGRLEDAALSLGAPPSRVLRQVTLPLLLPGLAGGWLFAAILSFTEFSASLFVSTQRTQTLPVAMYNYVREYADPSIAALSAIWIVTTMLLILAADRWLGLSRVLGTEVPGGR